MKRTLQAITLLALAAAALYTLGEIYTFSQTRFFTMDEYQYGHATWRVARGGIPYVDFFEHHFPLSYVLNAPFFLAQWDFVTGALLLRKIVFGYWVLLSLLAGGCCFAITRDRLAAMLLTFLPLSFGFGLMSAVDYRADNFGAIYFCACLLLLEWNRRKQSRSLAVVCGALATLAAGMTQKVTFVAGLTLAGMWLWDLVARTPAVARRIGGERPPFIAHPGIFFGSATGLGVAALAVAGAFGMLPRGFEITILEAAQHEIYYKPFSLFDKGYVTPFWEQTWPSTLAAILFAAGFLATRAGRFWILPIVVSIVGGSLIVAPYPYNFVLLCWLGAFAAVRGFAALVAALSRRWPALDEAAPLLYLLPLAAVTSQVGFVAGTMSNEHQLAVLHKIEEYGEPDDAVIDDAGGAMFSPDASYYWYHGKAHRRMFRDYFRNQLLADWRKSQALFWIWDMRIRDLPKKVRDYLHQHYIHGGDGLYVLGIRTPETGRSSQTVAFEVIRPGLYYFHRVGTPGGGRRGARSTDLVVDGKPLLKPRLHLDVGVHRIGIAPRSPEYVVTLVPASFFDPNAGPPRYSMLFQYREHTGRDPRRTFFSLAEELPVARNTSIDLDDEQALAHAGPDDTIEQLPGSVLRYYFRLPREARLRGKMHLVGPIDPDFARSGRIVVKIRSDEFEDTLTSERPSEPLKNPGLEIDANLDAYAGQMVEISIAFGRPEAADAEAHRLVWSGLRIDGLPLDDDASGEEGTETDAPPDEATNDDASVEIERARRNVFFVLFDTLRADRTQPYGSKGVATPALERLAERGTTFVSTHSNASWTAPSVASMLSAVYPTVHQISGTGWMQTEEAKVTTLHHDLPYLPEVLHDAGYATEAIVKNPFFHPAFGYGRGFEAMHALYSQRRAIREKYPSPEGQADAVWKELIAPLVADESRPFFLYLHELDPHHPYEPLPPYDSLYAPAWDGDKELLRRHDFAALYRHDPHLLDAAGTAYLNSQYDGEVSFMDAYLGRLLEHLHASGRAANTLVVFVSDHGESLTEHQIVGHGVELYEEILRVPLILSLPGVLPEGRRVQSAVELVDLPRTLLDLLDIEAPDAMQGRSLVPLIAGAHDAVPRPTYAQAHFANRYSYDAVTLGRWKLIRRNPVNEDGFAAFELYDLRTDAGEHDDRFDDEPIVGGTLRQMLAFQELKDQKRRVAHEPDLQVLDPELRKNLEALGYVD